MSRRKPYNFKEPTAKLPPMWRSIEEKQADPATLARRAETEKPESLLDVKSLVSRRGFLQVAGATAAVATMQGCVRRPVENILPYVQGPEYSLPGIPTHFATVTARGGDALGLLVTSHEGRPTKIEGNPSHPSNGAGEGAAYAPTDLRAQAAILDLYDDERARVASKRNGGALVDQTMEAFDSAFQALIARHRSQGGRGLRFLCQTTNSPSFMRLRQQITAQMPEARFHTYASVNDSNAVAGGALAFGSPVRAVVNYDRARVVLALDSDFLGDEAGSVRANRGFGATRAVETPASEMSRLYVVEAGHTITGASADHRLKLAASRVEGYLRALARTLATQHGLALDATVLAACGQGNTQGIPQTWLAGVAADLKANAGRAPIVVGRKQPARVHALAFALNAALGNIDTTIQLFPAADVSEPDVVADIAKLASEIEQVQTLVILGGNPVFDAPGDLGLRAKLAREGLTVVQLSSHRDETSEVAAWHCPLAHELEAWGDQRAVDGTVSVQQPLIAPLFHARSEIELLAMAAGVRNWRGYYVVRQTIRALAPNGVFESVFRRVLHSGVLAGSASAPLAIPALNGAAIAQQMTSAPAAPAVGPNAFEVHFVPDPKLFDGRHANNRWALELPDPMTKLVWDNAALMSPATRNALGCENGDKIRLSAPGGRDVEVPVFALPGVADNCITLALGWGRTSVGRYGNGVGHDIQPLRTTAAFHIATGVRATKLSTTYPLVQTQEHDRMEGRPIVIDATVAEYREEPNFASYRAVEMNSTPALWDAVDYSHGHKWGMTIDLSSCTGCNACVIACQAENNIPTVGKREVSRGREMYWLRIDRYFLGDDVNDPDAVALQPIGCQHCENAPCENVCPVNATAHSPEGLNDMAYNRCVGTRYCANNCPYKVRRFNYLDWHTRLDEVIDHHGTIDQNAYVRGIGLEGHGFRMEGEFDQLKQMQFNPNVTVRMRGVIEKCSYCVQRIEAAKIRVRREHRAMRDGDVVTACQTACATGSIVFGDLNDTESRVHKLANRDRQYKLLAEVGAAPRTTFLGKIRNPNPAMGTAQGNAGEAH